jgi:uncharacterized membrane protein
MTSRKWGSILGASYDGMMSGGGWMMLFFSLVLVVLLGAAVFVSLRVASPHFTAVGHAPGPALGSPREVLDRRLARGAITDEEYNAARALLGP